MKAIKLFFFLILFYNIYSQTFEIENGQTVELIFGDESEKAFIYNFIIPESDIYEKAILMIKYELDDIMYIEINEDKDKSEQYRYRGKGFSYYDLSSIQNKTITFTISKNYGSYCKFTLLDLTKEINTTLDNLPNIILTSEIRFFDDPKCQFKYNIEEIDSDQTYFFKNNEITFDHTIIGNGFVEYCYDENCLNNIYYSSEVIEFKKGSKYKIKLHYITFWDLDYYYLGFEITKYSEPIKLNKGAQIYNIEKTNLDHYYLIDGKDMDSFGIYSKSHQFIKYSIASEVLVNNLPLSLNEMEFKDYSLYYNINITSDNYVIIILKDKDIEDKNILYLYNKFVTYKKSFETFTLESGNYTFINLSDGNLNSFNCFISIESSLPSLKIIEDIDSFERNEPSTQIINQKIVYAYNGDKDVNIKIRYYKFEKTKTFNNISSINNDKLNYYLDEYGNSDSLFLRWKSNNFNYYGFATLLIFDLTSEYYLYFKRYYGNLNAYKCQIDDNTNLTNLLGIIKSYEDDYRFTLMNENLIVFSDSQLFSAFLNYGSLGDIYIQKVNDNLNIKLNNNDITGNLVKLLITEKMYILDFHLNHLIKLDNAFSNATVIFYDNNDNEIGLLDMNNQIVELNGENIKIKSNKNALLYFYSIMPNEKKLYEIVFDKEKIGKNMNITITNINSDNESIIFIKDYGFKNHYPMLSSNNWDKILIEKNKTTSIFIENPYAKLEENELVDNETFIIYIANVYDENGRPYFEEEKFEIVEINYKKNSFSKYNKFDFQVIEMNKESSIILSQSNKNAIKYEMTLCNPTYGSYHFIIDYSNSNISRKDIKLSRNDTYSSRFQNNEIMSHTFYMDNGYSSYSLVFYYNFENNMDSNLLSLSKGNENTIDCVIALNENYLEVKFSTYTSGYYKFYIIVALEDDNNNLSTFNQYCYLTKLITENINSNYSLKISYDYLTSSDYTIAKIDISNLKADINNKFVMNIINEDLANKNLKFNSPIEFIPERTKEIELYNSYEFRKNSYFRFNYTGQKLQEFKLQIIDSRTFSSGTLIIYIEGPDINSEYSLKLDADFINIYFNLTKQGIVYIKFIYKEKIDDNFSGKFNVYPIKKTIDIIDFNKKIYFFNYTLETENNELIIIYNVTSLTKDKIVYFVCSQLQLEICEISSQKCNFVATFYKFLANKKYFINAYSYDRTSSSRRRYMKPYIFGILNKEYVQIFNDLGVDKTNEPRIYLVEKQYVSSFYYIKINTYFSFYAKGDYEIDEIFNQLPNISFINIKNRYEKFDFSGDFSFIIILTFPNLDYELESYEKSVIGFSNKLYINKGKNEKIEIFSGENAFIIIDNDNDNEESLKDYYNNLRIVKSQNNNIALVDYKNSYDKLQDSLILNSKDNHSNFIYIDKLQVNNILLFYYYEPRYSYFYALDDKSLKNRTKIMKEKGYNSYFKRHNSEQGDFYGIFNKITFDLEDKINIFFRKYYGYSNIYEINLESYYINDLKFLTKPIKTYENEKSILNQLISLKSNTLYSGFLDYQTLYDIYIDIDNEDNIVKIPKEDNPFNNLIKLFKPNINYILDFEVNHLIKLDPNFNSEVTIIDSERTIILNKNNPTTIEIKGDNVQISTNSSAILYFYNSISSLASKSEIYKNMFQYEIEPLNDKILFLSIELIADDYYNYGNIYFLIDVGFKGYAPLEFEGFYFNQKECYIDCTLYFPNYYDKLKTGLVEGEKLFVYYYIINDESQSISTILTPTYYSSLKNINDHTFLVIPANTGEEEERSFLLKFYDKETFSFQAHYCSNNDGTKPIIEVYDEIIEIEDSKIYYINNWLDYIYILFPFSSNEFVFSYSFYDKYDYIINSTSNWKNDRQVIENLNIKKAEIDFNTNIANVQFTPNYINSSTKYFIIIGPKNDTFNIESFNNPCFLIELITENSFGVKIYEAMSIGEEYIDVNIDINDLISENSENKDYIVNIVSLELRFEKKLNFYKVRLFEKTIQVQINEVINFDGKNLFYELMYNRPNNISQLCLLIPKSISSDCEIIIENPNLKEFKANQYKDNLFYLAFECTSDGSYSINIHTLLEDESVQGSFKIISTGIPLDLDLSEHLYYYFYIIATVNYQPSPLIFNINGSKLDQEYLCLFDCYNIEKYLFKMKILII